MEGSEGARITVENQAFLLAMGRESYGLASKDADSGCTNGGSKKSRVANVSEYWHREDDTCNAVGLSQSAGVADGFLRAKQQNCCETSFQQLVSPNDETLEFSSPYTQIGIEHGYLEPLRPGHTTVVVGSQEHHGSCERFCSRDESFVVGTQGSPSNANDLLNLKPSWVNQTIARGATFNSNWDVAGTASSSQNRPRLDGFLRNSDSRTNLTPKPAERRKGKSSIMDCENRDAKTSHDCGYAVNGEMVYDVSSRVHDSNYLDVSSFSYYSSFFSVEDGATPHCQRGTREADTTDYTGHSRSEYIYGGSTSCKKRRSFSGLVDTSGFQSSQVGPSIYQNLSSTVVTSGQLRLDLNDLSPSDNDTNRASLVLPTHHLYNGRHNHFESFRASNEEALDLQEGESADRVRQSPFISMPQEEESSQSHFLFATNLRRPLPPVCSYVFAPPVNSGQQPWVDRSITNLPYLSNGSHRATVSNARRASSPIRGRTGSVRRRNSVAFSTSDGRESASSAFQGLRSRGLLRRVHGRSVGQVIENQQAGLNYVSMGSSDRAVNHREGDVQAGPTSHVVFNSNHDLSSDFSNSPSRMPTRNRGSSRLHLGEQSIFGVPFHSLHVLPAHGVQRQRFLSEILSALEHACGSEELSYEELEMLNPFLSGNFNGHDQYSDMRLDVDNMSYEELLALEERIGIVTTGLSEETISLCLRETKYSSLDATLATISQESDVKCSICQEEFVEEDELGRLDCGHGYHTKCVKQWLMLKNQCPICKAPASSKT